jgi:TrmH family RNA methyltransferase
VRRDSGWFLAEGLKLVSGAIEAGWRIRVLVHLEDSASSANSVLAGVVRSTLAVGGEVLEVTPEVLERLTNRDNPRAVVGVFEQRLTPLDVLAIGSEDLWVVLDRIRDPGNLGTIIRTCDAVGANGVMLVGDCTDPFGIDAVRATMGSIFDVPLVRTTVADFMRWLAEFDGLAVGTHLSATTDYRSASYHRPMVLLMGNEQAGLPAELADVCDVLVKIPMVGAADSLNLAVSTGIMLYELARDRL